MMGTQHPIPTKAEILTYTHAVTWYTGSRWAYRPVQVEQVNEQGMMREVGTLHLFTARGNQVGVGKSALVPMTERIAENIDFWNCVHFLKSFHWHSLSSEILHHVIALLP